MYSDRRCLLLIRVPAGHTRSQRDWCEVLTPPAVRLPTWWQMELVRKLVVGVQDFAKQVCCYNASCHPLMRTPAVHSGSWKGGRTAGKVGGMRLFHTQQPQASGAPVRCGSRTSCNSVS